MSEASVERERYVDSLTAAGQCVLLATTADAACRLAWELEPQAVIVTVSLSVCRDGVPLARRLKEDAHLTGVPVVILEAHGRGAVQLQRVGYHLFVARPNAPADMASLIAPLLRGGVSATSPARPAGQLRS